jgi:hypothetical protein
MEQSFSQQSVRYIEAHKFSLSLAHEMGTWDCRAPPLLAEGVPTKRALE